MSDSTTGRTRKKRRIKVSKETKEDLVSIIDDLSLIITRKTPRKDDSALREELDDAYNKIDARIAHVGIVTPELDAAWKESGARTAFLKLKKRRKLLVTSLSVAVGAIALLVLSGALLSVLFIDSVFKWVIVAVAVLILMFGITTAYSQVIGPITSKKDSAIKERFPEECKLIDNYVNYLLKIQRKS